jgi:hypothetical protein
MPWRRMASAPSSGKESDVPFPHPQSVCAAVRAAAPGRRILRASCVSHPDVHLSDVKGTGFSPYIRPEKSTWALHAAEILNPEGGGGFNPRITPTESTMAVSIHRQSRWLYGCWPLKGAFSQPSEAKARTKAKTSYCCLHCRSTGNSRENILPEFSKFDCHPGRAGGSPFWISHGGTLCVNST